MAVNTSNGVITRRTVLAGGMRVVVCRVLHNNWPLTNFVLPSSFRPTGTLDVADMTSRAVGQS